MSKSLTFTPLPGHNVRAIRTGSEGGTVEIGPNTMLLAVDMSNAVGRPWTNEKTGKSGVVKLLAETEGFRGTDFEGVPVKLFVGVPAESKSKGGTYVKL